MTEISPHSYVIVAERPAREVFHGFTRDRVWRAKHRVDGTSAYGMNFVRVYDPTARNLITSNRKVARITGNIARPSVDLTRCFPSPVDAVTRLA